MKILELFKTIIVSFIVLCIMSIIFTGIILFSFREKHDIPQKEDFDILKSCILSFPVEYIRLSFSTQNLIGGDKVSTWLLYSSPNFKFKFNTPAAIVKKGNYEQLLKDFNNYYATPPQKHMSDVYELKAFYGNDLKYNGIKIGYTAFYAFCENGNYLKIHIFQSYVHEK